MANFGKRQLTPSDVTDILGRALVDSDFRSKLINDPAGTISVLGFEQSQDSENFFRALNDPQFLATATTIENRIGGRPVIAVWL